MIPVAPKPEPASFDGRVRSLGQAFLAAVPRPNAKQFKKKPFWKKAMPDLKVAYGNVCAYSSCWMPGSCSVDHYYPKSARPDLAYEWSNFRLAHDKMNANKADSTDVLDPFTIQVGWFVLDVATLYIRPEAALQTKLKAGVQKSIDVLRLNDEQWVQMRFDLFRSYIDGECTLAYLQRYYPFIAVEIQRQGVQPRT
jgi:hypothetical protein